MNILLRLEIANHLNKYLQLQFFSVPGIAERVAFMSLDEGDYFTLFNNKHNDLVKLFLDNNVGGPALIFDRLSIVGK